MSKWALEPEGGAQWQIFILLEEYSLGGVP